MSAGSCPTSMCAAIRIPTTRSRPSRIWRARSSVDWRGTGQLSLRGCADMKSLLAQRAQDAVRNALRDGLLQRAAACAECGREDRPIEAAHFDYTRPLEIRWVWRSWHRSWDFAAPKPGGWVERRADDQTPRLPPNTGGPKTAARRRAALRRGQSP